MASTGTATHKLGDTGVRFKPVRSAVPRQKAAAPTPSLPLTPPASQIPPSVTAPGPSARPPARRPTPPASASTATAQLSGVEHTQSSAGKSKSDSQVRTGSPPPAEAGPSRTGIPIALPDSPPSSQTAVRLAPPSSPPSIRIGAPVSPPYVPPATQNKPPAKKSALAPPIRTAARSNTSSDVSSASAIIRTPAPGGSPPLNPTAALSSNGRDQSAASTSSLAPSTFNASPTGNAKASSSTSRLVKPIRKHRNSDVAFGSDSNQAAPPSTPSRPLPSSERSPLFAASPPPSQSTFTIDPVAERVAPTLDPEMADRYKDTIQKKRKIGVQELDREGPIPQRTDGPPESAWKEGAPAFEAAVEVPAKRKRARKTKESNEAPAAEGSGTTGMNVGREGGEEGDDGMDEDEPVASSSARRGRGQATRGVRPTRGRQSAGVRAARNRRDVEQSDSQEREVSPDPEAALMEEEERTARALQAAAKAAEDDNDDESEQAGSKRKRRGEGSSGPRRPRKETRLSDRLPEDVVPGEMRGPPIDPSALTMLDITKNPGHGMASKRGKELQRALDAEADERERKARLAARGGSVEHVDEDGNLIAGPSHSGQGRAAAAEEEEEYAPIQAGGHAVGVTQDANGNFVVDATTLTYDAREEARATMDGEGEVLEINDATTFHNANSFARKPKIGHWHKVELAELETRLMQYGESLDYLVYFFPGRKPGEIRRKMNKLFDKDEALSRLVLKVRPTAADFQELERVSGICLTAAIEDHPVLHIDESREPLASDLAAQAAAANRARSERARSERASSVGTNASGVGGKQKKKRGRHDIGGYEELDTDIMPED